VDDVTRSQLERAAGRQVVFAELWTGGEYSDECWEGQQPSATLVLAEIARLLDCSPGDVEYCADGVFRARSTPSVDLSWQGKEFDCDPAVAAIRSAPDAAAVHVAVDGFRMGPYSGGANFDELATRAETFGDAGLARVFATAAERLWAVDREAYPSSREVAARLQTSLRLAQVLVRNHPEARRIGREWIVPASAVETFLARPGRGWPKGKPRRPGAGRPDPS